MPGKRGSERRAMPGYVYVRLAPGMDVRLRRLADEAGMSASSYLRSIAAPIVGAEDDDIRPSKPRRPVPPPPPAAVVEVARLREVVGELAGALVQAAIRTRDDTNLHADVEAVLPGIRAAALDLDRLKVAWLEGPPDSR